MAKKRVPDWLNSPLWSVSPNDDRLRYSSATTSSQTDDTVVEPPTSVSPPASDRPMPPQAKPRHGTTHSRSSDGHDDINGRNDPSGVSSSRDSDEGISVQAQILTEFSKKVISMRELRRIGVQGVPDGAGIRSKVWKLLLGYLPPDRALWSSELAKKRSQYKHLKEDLLMNPSEMIRSMEKSAACKNDGFESDSKVFLSRSKVSHGEHPLSLVKTSMWNKFFQDMEIMEQIERDVRRTHPDMHFFSGDSPFSKSNQEALKNILVLFAKLNPGIRYVQGMNEVLEPIFYVFKNDPNEEMVAGAEADTFFCFVELLSGLRDNFCQQLDNSAEGIRSAMSRLSQLLKEHDEELWRHLEVTTKINPQFYAFRWITLLLTREFSFTDSLHIWDALLSDPEGPKEMLLRICCAMLILIRRRLLAGDFISNLKLLQNYPTTNISHLLYVANKLQPTSCNSLLPK